MRRKWRRKWKTRWHAFWRDRYVHQMVWYPTMIASSITGMLSVFGNGEVSPLFAGVFTQIAFVIGVYGALLVELLLDEEHPYDEKIQVALSIPSVSSVPLVTEKDINESINTIIRTHYQLQRTEKDEIIKEHIHAVIRILQHCKKYESLTREDKYILFVTMPQQLCQTLTLYTKLAKESKQKMKEHVHTYMEKQANIIVDAYIPSTQEASQKEIKKQMEVLKLPME